MAIAAVQTYYETFRIYMNAEEEKGWEEANQVADKFLTEMDCNLQNQMGFFYSTDGMRTEWSQREMSLQDKRVLNRETRLGMTYRLFHL
jgi:hypothetical protein